MLGRTIGRHSIYDAEVNTKEGTLLLQQKKRTCSHIPASQESNIVHLDHSADSPRTIKCNEWMNECTTCASPSHVQLGKMMMLVVYPSELHQGRTGR
jgi:hypothetical protein